MDQSQRRYYLSPTRILLAALFAALAWLVVNLVTAPASATASTAPVASSPAGTDDSLLGGLLDPAAPVIAAVDAHVATVSTAVAVPEPVREAVQVAEVSDTAVTHVAVDVPVVEKVVAPVIAEVVEPVAQPVLEPVVQHLAVPALEDVVSPVVDDVAAPVAAAVAPVVGTVSTPIVDTVVTPVVDTVVTPVVDTVVTPVVDTVISPIVDVVVTPTVDTAVTPIVGARASVTEIVPTAPTLAAPTAPAQGNLVPVDSTPVLQIEGSVPSMAGAPVPSVPTHPLGTPLSPSALPAPAGSSSIGPGPGNGPTSTATTPSGLLPQPDVRFSSTLPGSDSLPTHPSLETGSTPD